LENTYGNAAEGIPTLCLQINFPVGPPNSYPDYTIYNCRRLTPCSNYAPHGYSLTPPPVGWGRELEE